VTILDYAAACLASGRPSEAQQAFYQAILVTNDFTLGESSGNTSLTFSESAKVWQGEAYERSMIELLHGICLIQQGDFDNARVAFDRAIATDRYSRGGIADIEGNVAAPEGAKKSAMLLFNESDACRNGGGTVFRRDFLAAYVLRTMCFLHLNRMRQARQSWAETGKLFDDLCHATEASGSSATSTGVWTGATGQYSFPKVYLPPFRAADTLRRRLLAKSLDDLQRANVLIIAATGSRPKKVKTGTVTGNSVKFVHDGFLPPSEGVTKLAVVIDGQRRGEMVQCLNIYGQVAGRGPSLKDLAQEHKRKVEDVGEALVNSGNDYLQIIGHIVRAVNQEEADVRQWRLLPNSIHLWLGRLEPGTHTLRLLPEGANVAAADFPADMIYAGYIQEQEAAYARGILGSWRTGRPMPYAARHAMARSLVVPESGLTTLFVPEQFNEQVHAAPPAPPRSYELLPRMKPGQS
jgi:tetratricopeptide (TPR) repeat protein